MNRRWSSLKRLIEHVFLRYGSGSKHLTPIWNLSFLRWFAWVLIVLGVIGWIALFWAIRQYTE